VLEISRQKMLGYTAAKLDQTFVKLVQTLITSYFACGTYKMNHIYVNFLPAMSAF